MPSRLSERLSSARWLFFVGRENELSLFRSALEANPMPFHVLHVYGPGGVGKTTLLRAFAYTCSQLGSPSLTLDMRSIEPSPETFTEAICQGLGLTPGADPLDYIAGLNTRFVLMVDTCEALAPLERWLLQTFIPALPENTLVVLADRYPLSAAWYTDPGWQALVRSLALRNLAPAESRNYLTRRGIPEPQHSSILEFTHGHPLALSLLADVLAQRRAEQAEFPFVPEDSPDVVRTLLERFIQEVPGPAHRTTLEAAALVRVTSEPLLSALLEVEDAHELFDWLRGLSFIESRRDGVFPHDLAREALITDLRWRNPDWYVELHRRARGYYLAHLNRSTAGLDQQRILWDYIFLHRDNAIVKPFFEWQASAAMQSGPMHPEEAATLVAMVRAHEGAESAEYARAWLNMQPQNVLVIRDGQRQPAGFLNWLDLAHLDPTGRAADPATRMAWNFLQDKVAALRPGERAVLFRFWMARDTYQAVSPVQSLLFVNLVRFYLTIPGIAFSFFPTADPDFWAPGFAYGDIQRMPEVDFEVGGHRYGIFTHDWRVTPPLAWLDLMAEREMGGQPDSSEAVPAASSAQAAAPLLVLSQEEFNEAVREALRHYARPDELRANPLLRSRLVSAEAASTPELERAQRLRQAVQQAAQTFQESPRDEKLYRVLDKTYFHPAPTQEVAAELLDLPFSTYRRYLKTASERVAELLWLQEVGR